MTLVMLGEIINVDVTLLETLLEKDYTPIISTVGLDSKYNAFNINADDVCHGSVSSCFKSE